MSCFAFFNFFICYCFDNFLVCGCICSLNYSKQQIMRDRWMNVGYEEEELKPYIEPQPDYKDPRRTGGKKRLDSFINSSHLLLMSFSLHAHTNAQG